MKATLLCLCFASFGCAGTTPQDWLEEFARGMAAMNATYHAECDGREETPHCMAVQGHYNRLVDWLTKQNEKLPQ